MSSKILCAILSLSFLCAGASAQYLGPNGTPNTVRQVLDSALDHFPVVLQGRITRQIAYDDLYEFSDNTGKILVKINFKHWPLNLKFDDKTKVEIIGKYDHEVFGLTKIKVAQIRPID